jgi:hypothetical protein
MPVWVRANPILRPALKAFVTRCLTCFYTTEAPATFDAGVTFDGDDVARTVAPPFNRETFLRLRHLASRAFRKAGLHRRAALAPLPGASHRYSPHGRGSEHVGYGSVRNGPRHCRPLHCRRVDAAIGGPVNTTLKIAALALRTGDAITGKSAPCQADLARSQHRAKSS